MLKVFCRFILKEQHRCWGNEQEILCWFIPTVCNMGSILERFDLSYFSIRFRRQTENQ